MQRLSGAIQHYAWGTTDAIPNLLGIAPTGQPFAEYWLGAHPLAPATIDDRRLDEVLAEQPHLLGEASRASFGDQLPFLVKVLSARHALSLQAHPSRPQAQEGFAHENAAGIALDAAERTYRDDWPKPELMVALSEFHSLNGFREPTRTAWLFDQLGVSTELASIIGPLTERKGAAAMAEVFLDVLSLSGERAELSELVCAAAMKHKDAPGELGEFARTVIELDEVFPGDPGILAALLMNRVVLAAGEATFVPAGRMHAHLFGTGVEIMANSDNVVRGGLTAKHVDVGELVKVVDFEALTPTRVAPVEEAPGVEHFPIDCPEFDVWRIRATPLPTPVPGLGSARVLLVVGGSARLHADGVALELGSGDSAFLGATEDPTIEGDGLVFATAAGVR
jgi:mannose-6-phosphate isomerase, class I